MPHYVEKTVENGHSERPKKKRWSFGGLFRRKTRKESDTSSDDEESRSKGFLRRKKERGSKDVTGLFVVQGVGRRAGGSTGSLEIQNRRMAKAKVEASREAIESSSGDDGSYSSSLASGGGGSLNRKSRSARTERYMRRKVDPQWSPSPTRKPTTGLEQRSGSEQGIARKVRAPLYIPPPPPVRPPTVSSRSISDQYLSPPPIPHRKPLTSLNNSEMSVASTRSDTSSFRDQISHAEKNGIKKPPTPPERRSSRHSMVIPETFEIKKRNSSNLEQALNELEAIYNSLRLGDDDTDKNGPYKLNSKSGSESNFTNSQTSLSRRRSDRQGDDMAFRRWNKRNANVSDAREIMSQAGSYLLLSPTMSPPHSFPREPNEPHVTLDDVVYRNMNHTNNTLRICDPQPPFGIPIGPVTPAPQSDYLHVSPSQSTQHVHKSKRIPDVVLDDLAFRNLRKDAQDSTVNIKKKKATRSLSANLANILMPNDKTHPVRGNYYEVNNNMDEYKSSSYSDIPKDLRLAQRMLDIRLMNLRNKIKDQERAARMNSSSETLHNSNRSNSGTPERRTPTREPQRARFGSDGQFKYSDLHPRTPPERRIVFREEWRRPVTPEKKTVCKEELRKKFFADAYRNLDKTKPAQKLTENPHHRLHFANAKNGLDPARSKPPRAEVRERTVGYSSQQNSLRRSPVPHRTLTGDYFFPKDFEVPKSSRRSPTVDELYLSYSSRNKGHSPQRRVTSPRPATPPSSPVRTLRSSQLPSQEPKDVPEVTTKIENKAEPVVCNGYTEKKVTRNETEVRSKSKEKEVCQGTDSDSTGRATPSGEEVRRIMCQEEISVKSEEEIEEEREREENELLKKLEEEATATSLEMDRELMSLSVAVPHCKTADSQSSEVSSKKVADLLRELTRSLDYDFGPDDGGACSSGKEVATRSSQQDNSGVV